jgi:hypothetical protein
MQSYHLVFSFVEFYIHAIAIVIVELILFKV